MKANEIYPIIADKLIQKLEAGVIPWRQPWGTGDEICYNATTGRAYSVINCLLLGMPGGYVTFKQAKELGGQVKKGEKSYIIFQPIPYKKNKPETDEENEEQEEQEENNKRVYYIYKLIHVFNLSQCEGINTEKVKHPEGWQDNRQEQPQDPDEIEALINADLIQEIYFTKTGVKHIDGGDVAKFTPRTDTVTTPEPEKFCNPEAYFKTLFHEAAHSTGTKNRLNRGLEKNPTPESYAVEEIIAELASAFVIGTIGIKFEKCIEDSAGYIAHWIKQIKENPKAIYKAANKASAAANFILNL